MPEIQPVDAGNTRYTLELGRGERMFGLRRIGDARISFLRVQPFAKGDDRELVGAATGRVRLLPGQIHPGARGAEAVSVRTAPGRPRRGSSI